MKTTLLRHFLLGDSKPGRLILALTEFLLVFPVAILLSMVAAVFFQYTPAEITELQEVPRMLQGDTDYGGSNIFSTYVVLHLMFGLIGCALLTSILERGKVKIHMQRILLGMTFACVLINAILLFGFLRPERYFVCDYVQMLLLLSGTFGLSALWIRFLAARNRSRLMKYLLSPLMIVLLLVAGRDGVTPKAGKIVTSGEIPSYSANSSTHRLLLQLHRACTFCTGGWPP